MMNSFVNSLIISVIPGAAIGGYERGLKDGLAAICSRYDAEKLKSTLIGWMPIRVYGGNLTA